LDLRIEHECPSCGKVMSLGERDRVAHCPSCFDQTYLVKPSLPRAALVDRIPAEVDGSDIFYYPYMRFKGVIYTSFVDRVTHRLLDVTQQARTETVAPPSLGDRVRGTRLTQVHRAMGGRFIRKSLPTSDILQRAAARAEQSIDERSRPFIHQVFVSEVVSCIYLPLYRVGDTIFDGATGRSLGAKKLWKSALHQTISFQPHWQSNFLSTLCPHCGDVLEGGADSSVMHCRQCDTCWLEDEGTFVSVPYGYVPMQGEDVAHLPFWRLRVRCDQPKLYTLADLILATSRPILIKADHKRAELMIWVPAFTMAPAAFLNAARHLTLAQLSVPPVRGAYRGKLASVSVSLTEAMGTLKTVFAHIVEKRGDILNHLADITLSCRDGALVYLPFQKRGPVSVQPHTSLNIEEFERN
jgi:predicted  nucleic acid-binding Zn-ribbon protein